MQALTQEQAERAAKCCGPQWESELAVMPFTQKTDPDFWEPRLRRAMEEYNLPFSVRYNAGIRKYAVWVYGHPRNRFYERVVIALVEAIEALEGKK